MTGLDWVTAPLLPLWAGVSAMHPRLRSDWRQRWGGEVPVVEPGSTWIAAASVGEVGAALALARALPGPVLVTSDTDSGLERGRQNSDPRIVVCRRPVDHPWTLAPLLAESQPSRLVWVEGCYWPWLAREALRLGIPQVRVNARAGRGTELWMRFGVAPQRIVARDPEAAAWFAQRTKTPVDLGGDLKASAAPRLESAVSWARPFAILGCARAGDAQRVLDAASQFAWCLAPRHLSEVDSLVEEARQRGREVVRRSECPGGAVPASVDTLVLDSLGELAGLYPQAHLAVIGGTFAPDIGGHSPWEAAAAGIPIVAGPHVWAQGRAFDEVGAQCVSEADLASALASPLPASTSEARPTDEIVAELVQAVPSARPAASPRPWARPLAAGFSVGRQVWHRSYDRGWRTIHRLDRPVISVGSVNSRGPGKTSTVAWLGDLLTQRGVRVGVACRGVGRARNRGRQCAVSDEVQDVDALGDEGALLAARGFLVAACPDRVEAARALLHRGVDVVLLDDGLQHRRLHRDLDLGVVDARFVHARGDLPMGECREDSWCPSRLDGLVVHHGRPLPPTDVPRVFVERKPGPWHHDGRPSAQPEGPVLAFAGIGRPLDFFSELEMDVGVRIALRDHQRIDERTWRALQRRAEGRPMVCTAKDAIRLQPEWRRQVWWRGIDLVSSEVPEAWFAGI